MVVALLKGKLNDLAVKSGTRCIRQTITFLISYLIQFLIYLHVGTSKMPPRVFPARAVNLIYYKRFKIFIEEVIHYIRHEFVI